METAIGVVGVLLFLIVLWHGEDFVFFMKKRQQNKHEETLARIRSGRDLALLREHDKQDK